MNEYIDILIAIIITCVAIGFILGLVIFLFQIYIEIKDYLEDKL
jgi:flagellar biosynthesis protein FliQ